MTEQDRLSKSVHLCELFEKAMQSLLRELQPERAFIAYREKKQVDSSFPTPYVTHSLSLANLFTTEDISTEIVRKSLLSGEPSLFADAINTPHLNARTSVLISGLRSVLIVPLRHFTGLVIGVIYADSRTSAGFFKPNHLQAASSLSNDILAALPWVEKKVEPSSTGEPVQSSFVEMKQHSLKLAKTSPQEAIDFISSWSKTQKTGLEQGMAHGIRGSILEQQGRYEEALEALSLAVWLLGRSATAADERYSLMMNNLAGVHVRLGFLERAEGLLKTSLSQWQRLEAKGGQQEGIAATSYNLAKVCLQRGRKDDATSWLHQALAASELVFGAEHPKTEKVRQTLSQLQ